MLEDVDSLTERGEAKVAVRIGFSNYDRIAHVIECFGLATRIPGVIRQRRPISVHPEFRLKENYFLLETFLSLLTLRGDLASKLIIS